MKTICLALFIAFFSQAPAFSQTQENADAVRNEVIKHHVKNKKSALQGIFINLSMSALSLAIGSKIDDKDEQKNLYYSGASSFFYSLYNTWQYFQEGKIIKNAQRLDMQNEDADKMAKSLNKKLKRQKLSLYFGLGSSSFGIGINIYKAENINLVTGLDDKNMLKNFYYFRSAVSGYSLYDAWRKLKVNKRDTLRLKEITGL